ncbi:MAG: TetR/AcrR family transcriptional regulator [Chloroflexi bacterium]|nr:TetR/AcrR family transcriptional regulator [Chloroflexota bacterium]
MTTPHHTTEIRQQEIVEKARQILAARGMDALTMRALSQAVGVTEGAIYRHFRDKHEILLALIDDVEENLLAGLERAKSRGHRPLDCLENVLHERLSSAERRGGISVLVIGAVLRSGDAGPRQRMGAAVDRYVAKVQEILEEGVRQGQVRPDIDPAAAALAFYGLMHGAVALWRLSGGRLPLSQRSQALWGMFRRGIAAQ